LICNIADSLICIESHKIIHFNINPSNILLKLNDDCSEISDLKLYNFNKSFILTEEVIGYLHFHSDYYYLPPEIISYYY